MHVHLPKPLHGWRAFVGEVGIIVLGVLIALAAEQLVASLHERTEAGRAEDAIRGELEINMARLRSRHQVRAYVANRISELQALIDSASNDGGRIATPQWVGRPQFWTMQMSRWQATSQAGRAALIPPDQLNLYGSMYSFMDRINSAGAEEQDAWAKLRALEHLQRLTPDSAFQLQSTLQQARYINWRMEVWIAQLQVIFDRLHLQVVGNDTPASRSACVPLGTARNQAIRMSNSFIQNEP